jgi:hypothetical protein
LTGSGGLGEPVLVRKAVVDLDEGASFIRVGLRDVRVEEGNVAEGGGTGVEVDGSSKLFGGLGDGVESGDDVSCSEGGGSTTGGEGDLGVRADDSDLLALDGRGGEGKLLLVVLEEDDTVGSGFAEESADFGCVDLVFVGVEGDLRVDGEVEELEKLCRGEQKLVTAQPNLR